MGYHGVKGAQAWGQVLVTEGRWPANLILSNAPDIVTAFPISQECNRLGQACEEISVSQFFYIVSR